VSLEQLVKVLTRRYQWHRLRFDILDLYRKLNLTDFAVSTTPLSFN
jgi:hypothetical protein